MTLIIIFVMNLNHLQAFTFGPEPAPIPHTKHPKISKLSPFYQVAKPTTEQRKRKQDQQLQRMMQTLQRNSMDNKNDNKENYVSLNVPIPKHRRIPTDLQLIRIETSPHNSQKSPEQPRKTQTFRKLSFNDRKQLPSIRTNDEPDKYKTMVSDFFPYSQAKQLRLMFLRQRDLYLEGNERDLERLYDDFLTLTRGL